MEGFSGLPYVYPVPLGFPQWPGAGTGGSEGSNCNLLIAGGYSSQPLQRSAAAAPHPQPTAAQCCRISHSGQGRAEGFSRFLPPLPSAIGFPTAARGTHRHPAGSLFTFPVTQCFPQRSGVCGGVQRAPLRLPSSPGFSTVARSRHRGFGGL